jgi:DNA phosphorothioation-associated putative methyltransferase
MSVGKRVFDDLYVHLDAAEARVEPSTWSSVSAARDLVRAQGHGPNVLKYNVRSGRFSLLTYADFDSSPFPELTSSWTMSGSGGLTYRTYDASLNPPILHRKELLVPDDWPQRAAWRALTERAEAIGLFDDTRAIGFRVNWERLIASKGYRLVEHQLLPLGNETTDIAQSATDTLGDASDVQRHLTAMTRSSLSAPVQLLLRTGLLTPGVSFFDYGCGRGGDMAGLADAGYDVAGWDPYYAPGNVRVIADVVNLGFVVNVIEDAAERVDAIAQAAALARRVLAVSVMLISSDVTGVPYRDGLLTSRSTFQKYFSQGEFKDYLEQVLQTQVVMGGPGIALAFIDKDWEQRYLAARYRRRDLATRILAIEARRRTIERRAPLEKTTRVPREPKPPRPPRPQRLTNEQLLLQTAAPVLDRLWALTLDLGRWPDANEVPDLASIQDAVASLARAKALLTKHYDGNELASASQARKDDVLLFLASQQFRRRPPYRSLEERLQRDIKSFFGDYGNAQAAAIRLLRETADTEKLLIACKEAAERGLGWLEADHSLQLHASLVDQLPVLLRAYVACGLVLWDATSEVQLIKIHVQSGKLTLMEFDNFDLSPLPELKRRIKLNLRRLDYDIFDYGTATHPQPLLYRKSRYLNEDYPGYPEQLAFDEALERSGVLGSSEYGPTAEELAALLELRRLRVGEEGVVESNRIPDLDQACGAHFTFRDFVECGETQARLGIKNLPLNPATYNAIYALATQILDPVIEYFGGIRLTYGFCSAELGKHIKARVAPKLDQHAGCERNLSGNLICDRGGVSCDFVVKDENMREVADWMIKHTPFDRLYFYGKDQPVHVSAGPLQSRLAVELAKGPSGRLLPRPYDPAP